MNPWRTLRLLAIALALTLVATACSDDDGPSATSLEPAATLTTLPGSPATTGPPAPDTISGVYTTGIMGPVTTDNYWAMLDTEASSWNSHVLLYQGTGLYGYSIPDFLHIPIAAAIAAPPLEREGDGWTVTVPVREGMNWSDGMPVTAQDYVFAVNTNTEFGLGGNWLGAHPFKTPDDPATEADEGERWVKKVEALDERTVKITFIASEEPPGLSIYQNGILYHPMLPEHFWGQVVEDCRGSDDPKACLYAADGTGQPSAWGLVFKRREPGVFASVEANTDHYYRGVTYTVYDDLTFTQTGGTHSLDESYGPGGSPEIVSQYMDGPFVEEVMFVEYTSQDAAYLAFMEHEVDYVFAPGGVPTGRREQLLDEPDIDYAVNPSEGFRYVAFNLRKAPMNDPAFRQALAYVIDKEFVTERVLSGAALPIYSLVPDANTAWHTDEVNRWGAGMSEGERFDKAVQILADAGYTWSTRPEAERDDEGNYTGVFEDGKDMRQPDGTLVDEVELLTPGPSYDPLRSTFATWIGQWAERLGIPMDVEPTDFSTIVDAVFAPQTEESVLEWDMYMLGWGGGLPALPCTSHQVFFGADHDVVASGGFNIPGYDDAEFESLSDAFDAATNIETARSICHAMEKNIAENLPYIVLFSSPVTDVWRETVEFPITEILGGISSFANGWTAQVAVYD